MFTDIDFAWAHPEVLRLMSNENLMPPSEAVIQAILATARQANLYPGSGEELRRKLAEPAGLTAEQVLLGNGSTDIINIVVNAFVAPGGQVIIPIPVFSMYEARVKVNGGVPVSVPISPASDFYWDIAGMVNAITDLTKLIFICTPNNPTGNQIYENDLRRILDLRIPTFIDETFYELEVEPRTLAYLFQEYPHAIINRTLSKAYGLAGFRLGYAFADVNMISYLNRVRIPWNVSLVSLSAALAALDDIEDHRKKRDNVLQGRQYLLEEINKIPGLQAFPPEGNFVLIDASSLNLSSARIRDDIIARGVFIRPMSPHHMKESYFRVTVGTPEQNLVFLETLQQYVKEKIYPRT